MNVRITFSYMVFFQKSLGNVVTVVMMIDDDPGVCVKSRFLCCVNV